MDEAAVRENARPADPLPAAALTSVTDWLRNHEGAVGTVRATRCSGGFSNLTFRLSDEAGRSWILRRPPLGQDQGPAHDVLREGAVLRALQGREVPAPKVLATSLDGPALGFPYALVQFIHGIVISDRPTAEHRLAREERQALGPALMGVLASVHSVSPDDSGLDNRPRPSSYFARQIQRWSARPISPEGSGADIELRDRLLKAASTLPSDLALLHGDFHLGNVIVGPGGTIKALVDWEMAALGDPLVDLGCALAYWQQPDDDPDLAPLPTAVSGFSTRRTLIEAYGSAANRDLAALDIYVAFGHWKLAHIAADIHERFRRGVMGGVDMDFALVARQVPARLLAAQAALDGSW